MVLNTISPIPNQNPNFIPYFRCLTPFQVIYASGSRAKEALDMMEGKISRISSTPSYLDMGIKPERSLKVEEKGEIAIFLKIFSIYPEWMWWSFPQP